jgi:hypothetical protein
MSSRTHGSVLKASILLSFCGLATLEAQTVSVANRVMRSGGGFVAGATVTLAGSPQWTATTNDSGSFALGQGTSIQPGRAVKYSFSVNRNGVSLVLDKTVVRGHMELLAPNGRKVHALSLNGSISSRCLSRAGACFSLMCASTG